MSRFDFDAFRAALEGRDVERWLPFYADDAEWLEYRHTNPPRSPNVMRGHARRRARGVPRSGRRGGRRIIENVIVDHRDGRIVRQVEVEAWD